MQDDDEGRSSPHSGGNMSEEGEAPGVETETLHLLQAPHGAGRASDHAATLHILPALAIPGELEDRGAQGSHRHLQFRAMRWQMDIAPHKTMLHRNKNEAAVRAPRILGSPR